VQAVDALLQALASEGFWEKALLLIVGAALTGLLVPLVKTWIDRTTFERQKRFEATLARQSDVIKAQTQFLNDFSNIIWEFHKVVQRVSYTRLDSNRKAYQAAVKEYEKAIWDLLFRIRSAIRSARWFCSDAVHNALLIWYDEGFTKITMRLNGLIHGGAHDEDWDKHHYDVHEGASERNYHLVRFLAHDFGLGAIVEQRNKTSLPEKTHDASSGNGEKIASPARQRRRKQAASEAP
jgi:hypothetical protein